MSDDDPWKQHRILKRIGPLALLLYFFPFVGLIAFGHVDMRSRLAHLLALGWATIVVVMLILLYEVRCPRCRKRFYAKGIDFQQMTPECLHCGLPKYGEVTDSRRVPKTLTISRL